MDKFLRSAISPVLFVVAVAAFVGHYILKFY